MFYMATHYHNDTQTQLTLVDNTTSSSTGAVNLAFYLLFLEWHLQDPVDEFEFRRNGLVQVIKTTVIRILTSIFSA